MWNIFKNIRAKKSEAISRIELAESRLGIRFTDKIREFYITEQYVENEFWRLIDNINYKSNIPITVQIDKPFAKKIIETLLKLNSNEQEILIKKQSRGSTLLSMDTILKLHLTTYLNYYNPKLNRFHNEIIQSCYEYFQSDDSHLKVILSLWAHCGGWGGIIIKGKNKGFHGGGMHDHYQTVTFKNVDYEYNSNSHESMESDHVEMTRRDLKMFEQQKKRNTEANIS